MNPNYNKGIYTLILQLHEDATRDVGKLGVIHLKRGYYAYTGSARGSGGFKRISRHIDVLHGKNQTRKWHIDYLLPITSFRCAVASPTDCDLECVVAAGIGSVCEPILGFGCTDCRCASHLHFAGVYGDLRNSAINAHLGAGLSPQCLNDDPAKLIDDGKDNH